MPYKIKVPPRPVETGEVAALHWLDRWVVWETKHRRILWPTIGAVSVLVLVVAGVGSWWWWQNRQAAILAAQAAKFYPVLSESVVGASAEDKDKKTSLENRCKDALPIYQQMTARYGRSRLAPLALYYQANCQVELGHPDEAISLYRQVVNRYPATHEVGVFSATRLGYLYAKQGDRSKAIEQFKWLTEQAGVPYRDQAYYESGRLYEADGNREAALAAYQTVAKEFPKSPWTSEARVRIKALGGTTGGESTQKPSGETPPPAMSTSPNSGQTQPTEGTAK